MCFCIFGNWMASDYIEDGNCGMDKVLVNAMVGLPLLGNAPCCILCFYYYVLFDNLIFKLKFWFICRWVLSQWCIIQLLTFLSNLRMSGMQLKPSLMEQFIVITLTGNKCDLLYQPPFSVVLCWFDIQWITL